MVLHCLREIAIERSIIFARTWFDLVVAEFDQVVRLQHLAIFGLAVVKLAVGVRQEGIARVLNDVVRARLTRPSILGLGNELILLFVPVVACSQPCLLSSS